MPTAPVLAIALVLAAGPAAAGEVTAVPELDLERYAGRWFEIARYPNRFQRDCAGEVTATYTLGPDGRIGVRNECVCADGSRIDAEGVARLESAGGPASRLRVRFAPGWLSFLPFVWARYWVIDLALDYSHAVVGEPERKYLWVLGRTPALSDEVYAAILARLEAQGYDPSRLERTRQRWVRE
jgi:apolipoprotein D and lipocalin family protein